MQRDKMLEMGVTVNDEEIKIEDKCFKLRWSILVIIVFKVDFDLFFHLFSCFLS